MQLFCCALIFGFVFSLGSAGVTSRQKRQYVDEDGIYFPDDSSEFRYFSFGQQNRRPNQYFPNDISNNFPDFVFPGQSINSIPGSYQPFPFPGSNLIPPFMQQQPTTTQAPATTLSPAVQQCNLRCGESTTNEYNPVCGSDNQTYNNRGYLECARRCGANVQYVQMGRCDPIATPV